eukprot:541690_1
MSTKRKFDDGVDQEPPSKKQKVDESPYLNRDTNEWWSSGKHDANQNTEDNDGKNDLIDYFANIDYMITNESFENEEHEAMFIKNTIKEMQAFDDIVFMFEHPDISKVIEKIIQILPSLRVRQFISTFIIPELYLLMHKKCASHVLQTVFTLIPRILIEEQQINAIDTDSNDPQNEDIRSMNTLLAEIIDKLQKFDSENHGLAQLFIDERSTFVMRDLLWISSGVVRFNKTKKKHRMELHHIRKIPSLQKFSLDHVPSTVTPFASIVTQHVLEYKEKYTLSTHIKHHSMKRNKHSNILCGSLQVLMECLFITKCNDVLQSLIDEILTPPPAKEKYNVKQFLKDAKEETEEQRIKKHVLELISNESSSHLMQTMFEFGNKNVSLTVVKQYLNAKEIRDMALDQNGNYVLQSMLRRLFDVKSIQFIASSVQHHIVELFAGNKIGVLYCLIDAFTRARLKPNAMVKTILEQMNEQKGTTLMDKFLYLNFDDAKIKQNLIRSKVRNLSSKYSVLGCLLLQSIVKCNSTMSLSVCKSFLTLDKDRVIEMSKDSSGSHVIQSLIECAHVYDDIKWEFLCTIQDKFHILCTDKFGNYIMESVFFSLGFPFKQQFALKVAYSASILKGSKIGSMLYYKMKLDLLKRDANKWRQTIMKQRKHQRSNYKSKKSNEKKSDKKAKSKTKTQKQRNKASFKASTDKTQYKRNENKYKNSKHKIKKSNKYKNSKHKIKKSNKYKNSK